jgi:hypothetical protein
MRARNTHAGVCAAACALVLFAGGCGYFNALYNAQQKFAEAERAELAGNHASAVTAYEAAIDRAAVSYQKYPKSRWADDALLLISRAHFGRGTNSRTTLPDSQVIAAVDRLLQQTQDRTVRAEAFAYLGASRARLGATDALPPLDSAVAAFEATSDIGAFARVWRARARFSAGDTAGAWSDLEAVPVGRNGIRAGAQFERLTRAVATRDSAHWHSAMADITSQNGAAVRPDSILALLRLSVPVWGAHAVRAEVPEGAGAALGEIEQLRLALFRAALAAQAGDTTTAIAEGLRVAGASNTEVSSEARVRAARWILATSSEQQDLQRVRSILVPGISNAEAVQMIARIRLLEVLIGRASSDPVAMFLAGESARDELGAPSIARKLFLRAEAQPDAAAWKGKALLAAMELSRTPADRAEVESRMANARTDVYLQAARGTPNEIQFEEAETALRRESALIKAEAGAIAKAGDVSIARAVSLRDSVRLVLFRDSVQRNCYAVIDSLKTKGIRADSARAACSRVDTLRFDAVLKMDTTLLKGTRKDTILFSYAPVRPASGVR